jgi:SAM-dependent methyltransferase
MVDKHQTTSTQAIRLYRDLADWYSLLTPVSDYAEEAAFYRRLFEAHCQRPPRTLLDLGSGGGHNAAHLKAVLACTLVDLEPAMLALSRRINPECEHIQGDMRSVRLERVFDCVLVHDAVSYMTSRTDLASAIVTAFEHTAPGGVAMFQPDFVSETFEPLVVPFEHSSYSNTGHEVFLGLPPVADERGTT